MSVLNVEKKILFIHIPKTAGTSMERVDFLSQGSNKHFGIEFYAKMQGVNLDDYFKFAFVRNPYTRFASGVIGHTIASFKMERTTGLLSPTEIEGVQKDLFTLFTNTHKDKFDDFVVLKRQVSFLKHNGKIYADFIGKFENLGTDWDKLCKKIGLPITPKLGHELKGRYTDYNCFYTPETKKIVRDYFAEDFEEFGYD